MHPASAARCRENNGARWRATRSIGPRTGGKRERRFGDGAADGSAGIVHGAGHGGGSTIIANRAAQRDRLDFRAWTPFAPFPPCTRRRRRDRRGHARAIAVRRRRGGDRGAIGRLRVRDRARLHAALWAGTFVWLNTGPKHDPLTTWPLQLCHWVALADAIVLAGALAAAPGRRVLCGIALCTQAIFTPSWSRPGALAVLVLLDDATR